MEQPNHDEVRHHAAAHYASGAPIWTDTDAWNSIKRRQIDSFGATYANLFAPASAAILNAGAGCHSYSWISPAAVSFDRFPAQLIRMSNPVVGDLESLPFHDGAFDGVVCVGPVINYVSALEAICELSRVLRQGGSLLLHFESSDSLEHLGTGRWRKRAAPLRTINNGKEDMVWIYSRRHIWETLEAYGLDVVNWRGFHILSSAGLRVGLPQRLAAAAQAADGLLPFLQAYADDIILLARKH